MTLRRIFSEVQLSFGEVKDFFEKVVEASQVGQNAVDALVWPVLVDENFRGRFENALYVYTWCSEIRVSVFTAPVLDRECVETIFEGAVEKAHFNAIEVYLLLEREDFDEAVLCNLVKKTEVGFNKYDVDDFLSLVKHPDCDARLFAKVIDFICLGKVSVAARLIEELAHQGSLPVEWLIGVYSECWGHGFDMTIWFDFKYSSREITSVKQYVFSLICEHYEDMPESWVSHMLEDFRYKAQARIQARLISSPFTQR